MLSFRSTIHVPIRVSTRRLRPVAQPDFLRQPLAINVSRLMRLCYTIAVLGLALGACVPFPHVRQTMPEIYGVVTMDGAPMNDAQVSYCANRLGLERCERVKQTTTDSLGRFHFTGESTFVAFESLIGDPIHVYGIELVYNDRVLMWGHIGIGYSPKLANLRCHVTEKLSCT